MLSKKSALQDYIKQEKMFNLWWWQIKIVHGELKIKHMDEGFTKTFGTSWDFTGTFQPCNRCTGCENTSLPYRRIYSRWSHQEMCKPYLLLGWGDREKLTFTDADYGRRSVAFLGGGLAIRGICRSTQWVPTILLNFRTTTLLYFRLFLMTLRFRWEEPR